MHSGHICMFDICVYLTAAIVMGNLICLSSPPMEFYWKPFSITFSRETLCVSTRMKTWPTWPGLGFEPTPSWSLNLTVSKTTTLIHSATLFNIHILIMRYFSILLSPESSLLGLWGPGRLFGNVVLLLALTNPQLFVWPLMRIQMLKWPESLGSGTRYLIYRKTGGRNTKTIKLIIITTFQNS